MIEREDKIQVDIDRERIREIVSEALRMIHEYFEDDYQYTREEVLEQLEKILTNARITTQFFLKLGSIKIPDLVLRVDPKRKKVLCKSKFHKKVAKINHFMRIL